MMNKFLVGFLLCASTTVAKDKTLEYLRTFGRSSLTGLAQGLAVGHYKRDFVLFKNEEKIRSCMWLAGITGEVALHWKINKEYSSEKFAVGFLGLGVGQIAGEVVAALQNPDHNGLKHSDVLNAHLVMAAFCGAWYVIEKSYRRKPETAQSKTQK